MTGEKSNGRITLAILGEKVDTVLSGLADVKGKVETLHDCETRQYEFNKQVKQELWDNEGRSKIDCAKGIANRALLLCKCVLLPIGLLVAGGLIGQLIAWAEKGAK